MKKIIVVDNEPKILEFFESFLKGLGYQVEVFSSPVQCPLYYFDCPCDVLITDFRMPKINGIEFIRHLQAKQRNINKIAMISASWEKEAIIEAEKLGCHTFSKPFMPDDIKDWLEE